MYCQHSFFSMTTLYPSARSSPCISFFNVYIIIIKFTRPVSIMGKNIKVMPQSQVRSPGKGREALRQKS